jgi:hypothetical protein
VTTPDTPPAAEALLIVGGPRHGEQVTVPAGAPTWLDIITATTYYRRPFDWAANDPTSLDEPKPVAAYHAEALVHERIADNAAAYSSWWLGMAMNAWMDRYGEQVPLTRLMGPRGNGHRL